MLCLMSFWRELTRFKPKPILRAGVPHKALGRRMCEADVSVNANSNSYANAGTNANAMLSLMPLLMLPGADSNANTV